MKIITIISRYLMALILLVFGVNKFMHFMPMPEMSGEAGKLMGALVSAGYFMPILGIVMILTGLALVFKKHTALMLVIMAPITLNILLFHLILDPANIMMAAVLTVLHIIMFYAYRGSYTDMCKCCSGGHCKM